MNEDTRQVTLRDERSGPDSRHLRAYLDDDGNLHIDGHDLGPSTAPVSTDGEYEWFEKISAHDLPKLLTLLGAPPDADVLAVLERQWSGDKAGDLETLIRKHGFKVKTSVWSG